MIKALTPAHVGSVTNHVNTMFLHMKRNWSPSQSRRIDECLRKGRNRPEEFPLNSLMRIPDFADADDRADEAMRCANGETQFGSHQHC